MSVTIIDDEREHGFLGECEQCGKTKTVRRYEAHGLAGESRGFYKICFDCMEARITWKNDRGQIFKTPASAFGKVEKK